MGTRKYDIKTYIKVILEVIIVFLAVILLFKVFEVLPIGKWENKVVKFRLTGYLVMLLLPICKTLLDRSSFKKYGITLQNSHVDIDIALSCYIPSFAIIAALHLFNWRTWIGAFMVVLIQIAIMFIMLYITNKQSNKKTNRTKDIIFLSSIIIAGGLVQIFTGRMIMDVVSAFIIFFVVAAPAEEFFFRGYVQTKLNDVFDRKFSLFGVNFGWGLILSSLLFGVMHVFNTYNPLLCSYEISLPWGLWTTLFGLILGLVREKTNSLIAPIILHAIINFF
ncbi:MAG: CPBP family intramembrane glutamic endopeptidase [Clostridiaceae bacterium]